MAPIHDDRVVTIPACLNVGSQQSLELHRHHEQVPSTTYFANQAHYVALLMHHEVAAQEVPEEQLSVASPFHEDYWDDYLTVLEATRIEEQRQAFQGRSPTFEEGTEVTVASPDEIDFGAEPLLASTLMNAANWSRVETEDCLNGGGTFADYFIMRNVDDLKYDLFPVETYGFVDVDEYGETYGFVDEEEYGNRLHGNDFEKRIAHTVETSPACAIAEDIAVLSEKRRDHSAARDHYITVELDTDTPNYFVVKTLAKSIVLSALTKGSYGDTQAKLRSHLYEAGCWTNGRVLQSYMDKQHMMKVMLKKDRLHWKIQCLSLTSGRSSDCCLPTGSRQTTVSLTW